MNEYLNKDLLNEIEEKIVNLHSKFKNKFNLTETYLRNINIGDVLNDKLLYLEIPYESHENITSNINEKFIIVDNNKYIGNIHYNSFRKGIFYSYDNLLIWLYAKNDEDINNYINYIRYKLPHNYGKVTSINNTISFYNYVKIKNDETKLLEYNEKEWLDNEIPYLQYIDRIEQGIEDVANIFFKPNGYESKIWTTIGYYNIENSDYGLSQKPISYKDLDRWKKNIELLESHFSDFFCVWNVVSYIEWNEESNFEWEEY